MLNRLLLVVAIVGLGLCAYLLVRPSNVQTIRLEPATRLSSQLEQPQPAPKLQIKPAPTVKPRPTQAIAPREKPQLPVQRPATRETTPSSSQSRETTTSVPPDTSTAVPAKTTTKPRQDFQDLDSPPAGVTPSKILTPRADGAVWRLQAGAFKSAENADALRQKLVQSGLTAKIVQGEDGIARVLVGSYASRDEAQADNKAVSSRVP